MSGYAGTTEMKKKPTRTAKTTSAAKKSHSSVASKVLETAERLLLEHCEPQIWIDYITQSGRGRWPGAEQELLRRHAEGYDVLDDIMQYAQGVMNGRWPECERHLIELGPTCPDTFMQDVVRCAEHVIGQRWPEAEIVLLANAEGDARFYYAMQVVKGRWPEFEEELLHFDWSCWIEYCEQAFGGRWPVLEEHLDRDYDAGGPEALYEYASKIVKGRLPERLHNRMLAEAVKAPDKKVIKKYFALLE
jgi:hypothetical protein